MAKEISDKDRDLFRSAVGNIEKLQHNKVNLKKSPKIVNQRIIETDIEHKKTFLDPTDEVALGDKLFFARNGIQPKQLKQLRQGKLACQAECDLHGLTAQQAEAELAEFIYQCLQEDLKIIRIVHGKGYRSKNQKPVLKNLLNHSLREYDDVLAFCSAQAKDGGLGAVYVLLKTQYY